MLSALLYFKCSELVREFSENVPGMYLGCTER